MPGWHGSVPTPAQAVVPQGAVEQMFSEQLRAHAEQVAFARLMEQLRGQ